MTTSTKRLIVIVGPTGSGKTDLSIRIALHYGAPILSTDSRQMYRGLPIGTAQPTADQLQAVEHHFIASHDLADNLSCGEYETQALACLERLNVAEQTAIGTGQGVYVFVIEFLRPFLGGIERFFVITACCGVSVLRV